MATVTFEFKNGGSIIRDGSVDNLTFVIDSTTEPEPTTTIELRTFTTLIDNAIRYMVRQNIRSIEIKEVV